MLSMTSSSLSSFKPKSFAINLQLYSDSGYRMLSLWMTVSVVILTVLLLLRTLRPLNVIGLGWNKSEVWKIIKIKRKDGPNPRVRERHWRLGGNCNRWPSRATYNAGKMIYIYFLIYIFSGDSRGKGGWLRTLHFMRSIAWFSREVS